MIATGNDAADLQHDGSVVSLPNEGAQAVSVSATTSVGFTLNPVDTVDSDSIDPGTRPATYTNYGTNAITVATPGGDTPPGGGTPDLVYNAFPEAAGRAFFGESVQYAYLAGTSMAAPQVAGAAALVKSVNPEYNAKQIESVLKQTASVPNRYDKTYYGAGIIDPLAAIHE